MSQIKVEILQKLHKLNFACSKPTINATGYNVYDWLMHTRVITSHETHLAYYKTWLQQQFYTKNYFYKLDFFLYKYNQV